METMDILKSVNKYMSPVLISETAKILNESESDVSKTIDSVIPTLLLGFLSKANKPAVMEDIMNLVYAPNFNPVETLNNLPNLLSKNNNPAYISGKASIAMLFGNKQTEVLKIISETYKLKLSSVSKITRMIMPLMLGVFHKLDFNSSRLITTLRAQQKSILAASPKELHALLDSQTQQNTELKSHTGDTPEANLVKPTHRWVIPVLFIIAMLLLFYLLRQCNQQANPPNIGIEAPSASLTAFNSIKNYDLNY